MSVFLKQPNLDEYWYEQKVLADSLTMEYNAGWEVSYDGYDYNTGCIDFPKEKWEKYYIKRQGNNRYFAYVVYEENNEFVGYVNFHYNNNESRYNCGVVIEHSHRGNGFGKEALKLLCDVAFNEYKVDSLYDNFDENRNAFSVFEAVGFKKTNEYKGKRFNKDINIMEVSISKENYYDKCNYINLRH